jgi:uncharacterized coiled-coil protein SlyX
VLALSVKQCERRFIESAQVGKFAELEQVAQSQDNRITELEATYADLKHEKDNVTDGYRRLAEKHKSLTESAVHEKIKLAEAHVAEITQFRDDLDLEARSNIEYRQTVHHRLHDLREAVASSVEEVKVQCLPFPNKGAKVEEMIDWVVGEVKVVPDTIW